MNNEKRRKIEKKTNGGKKRGVNTHETNFWLRLGTLAVIGEFADWRFYFQPITAPRASNKAKNTDCHLSSVARNPKVNEPPYRTSPCDLLYGFCVILVFSFTSFLVPPPRRLCNARRLSVCLSVCLLASSRKAIGASRKFNQRCIFAQGRRRVIRPFIRIYRNFLKTSSTLQYLAF